MSDVAYDRDVLVETLVYHWPTDTRACGCGWAVLGASHPEHVADVYEASVRATGPLGIRIVPGLRASFAAYPGIVIREMHSDGQERRIDHVDDEHVTCVGVASGRRTRIKRNRLHRYVVADWPHNLHLGTEP